MKSKYKLWLLCAVAVIALPASALAEPPQFQGLGGFPGGFGTVGGFSNPYEVSVATGVSADGNAVVGRGGFPLDFAFTREAFYWTQAGGMVALGVLPGGATVPGPNMVAGTFLGSTATGISADGLVVVGTSSAGPPPCVPPPEAAGCVTFGFATEAFRWTAATGMVGLGYLPGDIAFSSGTAVNSDGTVIVGNGYQRISPTIAIMQAFRWTQSFGMVGLGFLPGYAASFAYAVSADGAVVAGTASSDQSSGFPLGSEQAVRWTQSDGLVGLGFLPGGSFSTATGISSDGMVVIGTSTKTAGANEAFRWTQKGGMVALGRLPGRAYSIANAVSADGSVVVGSSSGPGQKAFRWTQSQGMVDVADLLIASGVQVGSWNLQSATAVSADGSVIVGYGAGPAGRIEAWWAKIGVNTGFLTTSVLNQSLQSVGALPQFAAQTATSDLDHALISALQFGRSGFDEPLGGWAAWGSFGRRQFHGGYGPETGPEGAIGFSRRVSQAWRIGVGAHRSKHDLDLPAYEGHADGDVWGVSATAAFEAGDVGPRAYASIMSDWFSTDITRGYLNGIMPDRSRGKRKGKAYGAAAELGWLFPIFRSASLMPFVLHQAVKLELDPYTEATGAFPAAFNGVDHESQITRVGAEVRSPGVHLHQIWASANWAHQHDAKGIDVAGRVIALNSPFSVPGQELRSDWLEAALGASLRLMPGVLVDARVTAAERGAAGADFSAGLGIVARI